MLGEDWEQAAWGPELAAMAASAIALPCEGRVGLQALVVSQPWSAEAPCRHAACVQVHECKPVLCTLPTYNSMQLCRYESRGLFFQPPIVGLIQGLWTVNLPAGMNAGPTEFQLTWASQDEILDTVRDGTALAAHYRQHIEASLDR